MQFYNGIPDGCEVEESQARIKVWEDGGALTKSRPNGWRIVSVGRACQSPISRIVNGFVSDSTSHDIKVFDEFKPYRSLERHLIIAQMLVVVHHRLLITLDRV